MSFSQSTNTAQTHETEISQRKSRTAHESGQYMDLVKRSIARTKGHMFESSTSLSDDDNTKNAKDQQTEQGYAQKVVDLSPLTSPVKREHSRIVALQEWEGHVLHVGEESFSASLVDKTSRSDRAEEIAEFDIGELSESDLDLLKEGAVFGWIIGYETTPAGTRKRVSYLYFRRLPTFRTPDLQKSKQKAAELYNALNDERDKASA